MDLLARLERLENLVASQERDKEEYPKKGIERPAAQQQSPVTASRPVPPRLQRLTADALQLERSCSDQKLTVSFPRGCLRAVIRAL